jgi:uncharacterized surface protein with fasciclin (FAS1) repeats
MSPRAAPRAAPAPLASAGTTLAASPEQEAAARRAEASAAHHHDILTTAEGSLRLGVFVDYMRAAGLAALLLEKGPYTVFAPTDRAFLKLPLRERDALLADRRRLGEVMRGHVVAGSVHAPESGTPLTVSTIDGRTLTVTSRDGAYYVDGARLVQTSIPASNGIIHAIDALLLPI